MALGRRCQRVGAAGICEGRFNSDPLNCYDNTMNTAKFLGMVRVWQEGEQWRWAPVGEWAPEHAVIAKRYRTEGEEIISIEHGDSGEFLRGAERAEKQ